MRLTVQDKASYKITSREYTDEGYLKVPGRVAKTGTQDYLRKELELDGNPNDIVVVYRPESEVFSDASLSTYNTADIAVLHPKTLVNSKTYKEVAVGVVKGNGRPDGDYVVCDLVIKDAAAIKKAEDGLVELSAGYTAEYFDEKGTAPDGTAYDYVQRDIKINHVALVPSARAGRKARLFDNLPTNKGKNMQKVTLDAGRVVEIQDEAVALLVTDSIARLQKVADEAQKSLDEAKADSDKKQAKIDALEDEAEKKKGDTADSIITQRLTEISEVKDKAFVIDATFTSDSIAPVEIMRGVLAANRPTVDWETKSADYVTASFDLAHENAKSGVSVKSADQKRQLAHDGAKNAQQVLDEKPKTARDEYIARMKNPQEAK